MQESRPGNKTIFTVLHEDKVDSVIKGVEYICGSLDEPGTGILITLPVGKVKGLK